MFVHLIALPARSKAGVIIVDAVRGTVKEATSYNEREPPSDERSLNRRHLDGQHMTE